MKKGKLFIISGPSGVGKDTIVDMVIKKNPKLRRAVTYTNRKIRPGEKPGRIYKFVSTDEFRELVKKGEISEWAKVHGHLYGGSIKNISESLEKGENLIFDIDVGGGLRYKEVLPEAALIFLKYSSLFHLVERLKKRPGTTDQEIEERFQNAQKEMKYEKDYDFRVVNPENHPEKAVVEIEKIIEQEIL